MNSNEVKEMKDLISKWEATGRIATVQPRLKRVSLNGMRSMSYSDALTFLREFLKTLK